VNSPSQRWSVSLDGPVQVFDAEGQRRFFLVQLSRPWVQWVEDHPVTGHDYLIVGEHDSTLIVLNLTEGTLRELETPSWLSTNVERVLLGGRLLVVRGHYYACGEEFRFLDFRDPSQPVLWNETRLGHLLWHDCQFEERGDQVVVLNYMQWFKATGQSLVEVNSMLQNKMAETLKERGPAYPNVLVDLMPLYDAYNEDIPELWDVKLDERRVFEFDGEDIRLVEQSMSERLQQEKAASDAFEAKRHEERVRLYAADPYVPLVREKFGKDPAARYPSRLNREEGEANPFFFEVWGEGFTITWGATHGKFVLSVNQGPYTYPRTMEGFEKLLRRIDFRRTLRACLQDPAPKDDAALHAWVDSLSYSDNWDPPSE
jgi:hypothetical protein